MKVTHTAVPMPSVFALAPSFAQGESEERPRPVPSTSRMSESAAAAAAPAKIAAHETALAPEVPAGSKASEPRRDSAARVALGTDMVLPLVGKGSRCLQAMCPAERATDG